MNKLRNVLFEELAQHSKADAQCEKTMMSAIGTEPRYKVVIFNLRFLRFKDCYQNGILI